MSDPVPEPNAPIAVSPTATDLSVPQRQSPIAVVAELFNVQLLVSLAQWLIPLAILGLATSPTLLSALAPALFLATMVVLTLKWHRTVFWIENDELILEKGVLNRSRLQIPLDRIQQISTEQGIVQQMFGVRRIRVDTAGSAGAEFSLAAVTDDIVRQLRTAVVGGDKAGEAPPPQVDGTSAGPITAATPAPPVHPHTAPQQDRRTMLVRHAVRDLVEIAIARPNGQILGGVVALTTLGVGGAIRSLLSNADLGAVSAVLLSAAGVTTLIIILVGSTVLREFELTVWRSDEGLRLTAGLIKKREQFARTERVQLVRYRRNFVERRFNRTSVYFPQASATAGGIDAAANRQLFGVPGAPDKCLDELTELFLPELRPAIDRPISERAVDRWTKWGGLLPGAVLLIAAVIDALLGGPVTASLLLALLGALTIVVARLVARRVQRGWRWGIDERVIGSQNGVLNINRVAVAIRKIQSVRLHQGWWHRRNQLATVEFGTASGSFRLPHLPLEVAQRLRDEVLFVVESDTGAWM